MINAIPKTGDSHDDLSAKIITLIKAFKSDMELTGGSEAVEELISSAGSRALGETIARDYGRLRVAAGSWTKSLDQAATIMRTLADQT